VEEEEEEEEDPQAQLQLNHPDGSTKVTLSTASFVHGLFAHPSCQEEDQAIPAPIRLLYQEDLDYQL
jgi:hypothetical protein